MRQVLVVTAQDHVSRWGWTAGARLGTVTMATHASAASARARYRPTLLHRLVLQADRRCASCMAPIVVETAPPLCIAFRQWAAGAPTCTSTGLRQPLCVDAL